MAWVSGALSEVAFAGRRKTIRGMMILHLFCAEVARDSIRRRQRAAFFRVVLTVFSPDTLASATQPSTRSDCVVFIHNQRGAVLVPASHFHYIWTKESKADR
jgi:hypothetical protein